MKYTCKQCGKEFEITDGEAEFYRSKGLNMPKRCKECREKNKAEKSENDDKLTLLGLPIMPEPGISESRRKKKERNKTIFAVILVLLVIYGLVSLVGKISSSFNKKTYTETSTGTTWSYVDYSLDNDDSDDEYTDYEESEESEASEEKEDVLTEASADETTIGQTSARQTTDKWITTRQSTTKQITTKQTTAKQTTAKQTTRKQTTAKSSGISESGSYFSKNDVALYIHTYGHLPSNFITKKQAEALGWNGGSVQKYAPGKAIGGDYYGNYEGLLPEGKTYHECDINTDGKSSRGAERIIYSTDGSIYYTSDHYNTFTKLY